MNLRIESERPAMEIVDEAFRAALSQVHFTLDDRAPVTYGVTIRHVAFEWSSEQSRHTASLTMDVFIAIPPDVLGSQRFSETRVSRRSTTDDTPELATILLSLALTSIVEEAVEDPELLGLIDDATSRIGVEGKAPAAR